MWRQLLTEFRSLQALDCSRRRQPSKVWPNTPKLPDWTATQIEALAREFTSHGKKAAIDFYRGPIKTTYGYYTAQAIIILNFLIGNVDHVGGFMKGGGAWDGTGGKPGQPFPMAKLHPNVLTPLRDQADAGKLGSVRNLHPLQAGRLSGQAALVSLYR